MQQAVKQLLGISRDISICLRFVDPPHETVGCMSAILHQPSYLVDLMVHPILCKTSPTTSRTLQYTTATSLSDAARKVKEEGKDPYCIFREKYCNGRSSSFDRQSSASVRERFDSEEMSRLISRLSEVSVCLHRTQLECELIEKRCALGLRRMDDSGPASAVFGDDEAVKSKKKMMEHIMSSSSYSSADSGKGSMVGSEVLESVEEGEEEEEEAQADCGLAETERGVEVGERGEGGVEVGDRKVEQLLQIAHNLMEQAQRQQQRKGKSNYLMPVTIV